MADLDLFGGRRGERDADGVADALAEQDAEGRRALDRALERGAGLGDAEVQRPVAPLGEQAVGLDHDDRVVVLDRDLEVVEVVLLEQRRLPDGALGERLGRGLAVLLQERGSSDPAFTPMRSETPAAFAASAISPTWSSNLRMLPGFTRTAAQPASIAWKTYFGWKWMSAMTGIWLFFAMMCSTSASSCEGTATRTISQPDAVSSAICWRVALMSVVGVVVIDCTLTGASPPTSTLPTLIWRDLRRGARTSGTFGIPRLTAGTPPAYAARMHTGWMPALQSPGHRLGRTAPVW